MSRPWEDTVVLALRDIQWMDGNNGQASAPPLPDIFLKLDGDTEKTLGDLIFQKGEKFYLFEVKSARGNISSEWNKKNKDGERKRKTAYEVLSALLGEWVENEKEWSDVLKLSLTCHHFVYWSDRVFDINDTLGNIMVEPYVSAAMAIGGQPDDNKGTLMPVCDPLFEVGVFDEAGKKYQVSKMLPFSALRSNNAYVVRSKQDVGPEHTTMDERFGAELDQFKRYLEFICRHAGEGGEIRAVICSDQNRFTKIVTSIEDLREQLTSPANSSKPVSKRTLQTRTVHAGAKVAKSQLGLAVAAQTQTFPSLPKTALGGGLHLRFRR